MSYGFRAFNNAGIVSVDEDSQSYIYLGKVAYSPYTRREEIVIFCSGYPLIFFDVPYNVGPITGNSVAAQIAVAMIRLRPHPNGDPRAWIVTMCSNCPNVGYLRVFGLLHRNYPSGSGEQYGARLWNSSGQLTFDTGFRQLRLAGNSYDTELLITGNTPHFNAAGGIDTSVSLPFDMSDKSIMANTRGTIADAYMYGSYTDWENNQYIEQWAIDYCDTGFWSSGNTLYARKFSVFSSTFESGGISIVGGGQSTYTKVAVIDNNLFP
jgi:hypothetical protein